MKYKSRVDIRCTIRYRGGADKPVLMEPGKIEKLSFDDSFIGMKKLLKEAESGYRADWVQRILSNKIQLDGPAPSVPDDLG